VLLHEVCSPSRCGPECFVPTVIIDLSDITSYCVCGDGGDVDDVSIGHPPISPPYVPTSPVYVPTSPVYVPTTPVYSPTSPSVMSPPPMSTPASPSSSSYSFRSVVVLRALPAVPLEFRRRAYMRRWYAQARASRLEARELYRRSPRRSARIASRNAV
jgi:hypothetical protein